MSAKSVIHIKSALIATKVAVYIWGKILLIKNRQDKLYVTVE